MKTALAAVLLAVGALVTGCGGSAEPDATASASATSAAASASPSRSSSSPTDLTTAAPSDSDDVAATPTPVAPIDSGEPEPGAPTTADEGFTCIYADVDGSVTVPCDAEICVTVGCLRSDGVYIGPYADEMNSAAAAATESADSAESADTESAGSDDPGSASAEPSP